MKIIADTHCHTIASTHAYSTVLENINAAADAGLRFVAITDHGKAMPGSPGPWYFENLSVIPREVNGVFVLRGIEANVLDIYGSIDVSQDVLDKLDWVVASMHELTFHERENIKSCTDAWLNVAKNPDVNVIGHSGVNAFKFDYERVIPEFGKNGKLVEINNSSFKIRKDSYHNCLEIASLCKKYGVSVVLDSDAHFCTQIGDLRKSIDFLAQIDFPEELIINANVERFTNYLKEHTTFFK